MARKIFPLSGTITENTFLTGNNWISGDLTITSDKTVTAKSNSTTYLLDNVQLTIGSGTTFVIEPDAQIVMGSGSLVEVESGATVRLEDDVEFTIPGHWQADAGSLFKFGDGAQLIVNGRLVVDGNSNDHVTFTRDGPSVTWDGIVVDNSASEVLTSFDYADISYCATGISTRTNAWFAMSNSTVTNATIGLEIVPGEGDGPSTPPTMMVTDNSFTEILLTGVSVNTISTVVLDGNTISCSGSSPYMETYGAYFDAASPQLLRNHIGGFTYGLYCTNASSPVLEDDIYPGNNQIEGNITGVLCEGSEAVLGYIGPNYLDVGGENSIFNNSGDDVVLISSKVEAENNYWGTNDDPPGRFDVDNESYLDYDPWLKEDPNSDHPLFLGGGRGGHVPSLSLTSMLPAMREAMDYRSSGRFGDALSTLKTIVANDSLPDDVRVWALHQALAVSQRIRDSRLSRYLVSVTRPALVRTVHSILPAAYLFDGSNSQAMAAYDQNIQEYPHSAIGRTSLYGKFIQVLFASRDVSAASELLASLESEYEGSAEASLARAQLYPTTRQPNGLTGPSKSNGLARVGEGTGQPVAYSLANYPNPFNPATRINYHLPAPGQVSLVVYDLLGRKAAELVTGYHEAGYHSIIWNASDQASGVYFARITVSDPLGQVQFTKISKLALVK